MQRITTPGPLHVAFNHTSHQATLMLE